MGIFKKLFRRRKITIHMTPEEAYAPIAEEENAAAEPEAVAEAEAAAPEAPADESVQAASEPPAEPFETADAADESAEADACEDASAGPADEPADVPAEPEAARETLNGRLFACLEYPDRLNEYIRPVLIGHFRSVCEDGLSFSCTADGEVSAEIACAYEQDAVDALKSDIQRVFSGAPCPKGELLKAVLTQISLFNVCLEINLSAPEGAANAAFGEIMSKLAGAVNGFYTSGGYRLYTQDAKLLMSSAGESECAEFVPAGHAEQTKQAAEEDGSDAFSARRRRSEELMRAHGISASCAISDEINESLLVPRRSEDVISRAAALLNTALTAKAYTSPRETASPRTWSLALLKRFNERYAVSNAFTPKEKAYADDPVREKHAVFLMRSESCAVLLWALGLYELPWPDKPAELARLNEIMRDSTLRSLELAARPRSAAELADAYDLTARLHSFCVRSTLKELAETGLDPDIVYERHYALNWLLTVNSISDWDSIIPMT